MIWKLIEEVIGSTDIYLVDQIMKGRYKEGYHPGRVADTAGICIVLRTILSFTA